MRGSRRQSKDRREVTTTSAPGPTINVATPSEPIAEGELSSPDGLGNMIGNISFAAVHQGVDEPFGGIGVDVADAPADGGVDSFMTEGKNIQESLIPLKCRPTDFCAIPWELRKPYDEESSTMPLFGSQVSKYVICRIEFAIRITFIAIIPAAILAYHENTTKEWVVPFMVLLPCIVIPQATIGATIKEVVDVILSLFVFVVTFEIVAWIDPARHWAAWGCAYGIVIILVATLFQGLVTKLALFFFTLHMVMHYNRTMLINGEDQRFLFPLYFLKPIVLGIGLAFCVPILPFPRFQKAVVEDELRAVCSSISICFHGVCRSLWVTSNTEREMNLARIRAVRENIDGFVQSLNANIAVMRYEPWPRSRQARAVHRIKLAERALASLDGMISLIDELASNPDIVDKSDRAQIWGEYFLPSLLCSCNYVDEFFKRLQDLSQPITDEHLEKLHFMQNFVRHAFSKARHKAIVEDKQWLLAPEPEKVFPFLLVGFQLFSYGNFIGILSRPDLDEEGANEEAVYWRFLLFPVRFVRDVGLEMWKLMHGDPAMLIKLREAVKLSATMVSAIALFMTRGAHDPAGGAAVIGFTKDADPSVNVAASLEFILGSVLGSVIGFLCASVSRDLTELICWIGAVAFVTGFVRSGSRYGGLGFLGMFFALSGMTPEGASPVSLLATIQENIGAMLWLAVTHMILWPTWPSEVLLEQIRGSFGALRKVFSSICEHVKSGEQDVGDLFHELQDMRSSVTFQVRLLSSAAQEPSLKKLPFPESTARAAVMSTSRLVGILAPVIEAIHVACKNDESTQPEDQRTIAWTMLCTTKKHLDDAIIVLNHLLREVEACLVAEAYADLTGMLLKRHHEFSMKAEECVGHICTTFLEGCAKPNRSRKAMAAPFQVPALQTIAYSMRMLINATYNLVLAVVELRRKRALRG